MVTDSVLFQMALHIILVYTNSLLIYCVIYRNIRTLEDVTRNMFHFAAHLNDRLVFRDFGPFQRLSKALQEVSTIKFGVNIGTVKSCMACTTVYCRDTI